MANVIQVYHFRGRETGPGLRMSQRLWHLGRTLKTIGRSAEGRGLGDAAF